MLSKLYIGKSGITKYFEGCRQNVQVDIDTQSVIVASLRMVVYRVINVLAQVWLTVPSVISQVAKCIIVMSIIEVGQTLISSRAYGIRT